MASKRSNTRGRGPPAVAARRAIPTPEELMGRIAQTNKPPPVPNRGNRNGARGVILTPQEMMGGAPPPLPARGAPTAEQLMNRMDEIKFQQVI